MAVPALADLRRFAVARSLFTPTTLPRAIGRLGFVQADPIRAPARAQDLTLRHRVRDYRVGDLERRYPRLGLDEDFFVNYGWLPSATQARMHPRRARTDWPAERWSQALAVQDFVRARGEAHPRDVDAHFQHGAARNWFGGGTRASTQLLDGMHHRGLLRVARREGGTRVYAAHDAHRRPTLDDTDADAAFDELVDVAVALYAPVPATTLGRLVAFLAQGAVPQWHARRGAALARARQRLTSADVDGRRWFWPTGEQPATRRHAVPDAVRLLAPFDPVVWDRDRFEVFWGWAYRFEAYTPAARRVRGHYALPLLWRDAVIGWANLAWGGGVLTPDLGYVAGQPPDEPAFRAALDDELDRMTRFLRPRDGTDTDTAA